MHTQDYPSFNIPPMELSRGKDFRSYDGFMPYPYTSGRTYHSPFRPLNEFGQEYNSTFNEDNKSRVPNTVSNIKYNRPIFIFGNADVDYLYVLFQKNPNAFYGSHQKAFDNRQSVFNLVFRLLSKDYYSFLREQIFNENTNQMILNPILFKCLIDIFKTIGLTRVPNEKPSFPLIHYREWLTVNQSESKLQSIIRFEDFIAGEPNQENTANFIKACLRHGGIAYLIEALFTLYGTVKKAQRENL